jgi:hypothetical protein
MFYGLTLIFLYLRHNENFATFFTFLKRIGFWAEYPEHPAVQSPDE